MLDRLQRFSRPLTALVHRVGKTRLGALGSDVRKRAAEEHLSLLAAGLSFYGMLAIVPGLIAFVSFYGLFADVGDVPAFIDSIGEAAPAEVSAFLESQLTEIVDASSAGLGASAALSLVAALWAASAGTTALMRGVNLAFGIDESRPRLRRRGIALVLTLSLVVFVTGALLVASVGARWLGGGLEYVRWPLLLLTTIVGLAVLYRVAPARPIPTNRVVTAGAVTAALGWLAASYGLSIYVSRFGSFNETYGTLGAVIVTLVWLFVSGYVVLLGAVLDASVGAGRT